MLQSKNPFKLIQQHSFFPNEKHVIGSTLPVSRRQAQRRNHYRKISQPRSLYRSFLKKITYNQHVLYRILVIADCKVSSVHYSSEYKLNLHLIDIKLSMIRQIYCIFHSFTIKTTPYKRQKLQIFVEDQGLLRYMKYIRDILKYIEYLLRSRVLL